jgi:hypothetical protein
MSAPEWIEQVHRSEAQRSEQRDAAYNDHGPHDVAHRYCVIHAASNNPENDFLERHADVAQPRTRAQEVFLGATGLSGDRQKDRDTR